MNEERKQKNKSNANESLDFQKTALRVSKVSILGNALLSLVKFMAGLIANSSAMVSDAIHSASDVFSSIVVIIGVKLASEDSDKEHPYGHDRLESVAAIILAVVLAITGLFIGERAITKLVSKSYAELLIPGRLALAAAIVSIIAKEAMYWYTRHFAKAINSGALMADAWHHRSDALSSVGSLIGIVGSRMGYRWFDPMASLIICVFILKAAYDVFIDAITKMIDHSCGDDVENEIIECACKIDDVIMVESIQTREFGSKIYVDLYVLADENLSLKESNRISEQVHDSIEKEFPRIKHIIVVVKPMSAIED